MAIVHFDTSTSPPASRACVALTRFPIYSAHSRLGELLGSRLIRRKARGSLLPPLFDMSNYEFSDAQLRVLSTVGDAALQAFTGSEAEEIVAAIPASFSEEQRALGELRHRGSTDHETDQISIFSSQASWHQVLRSARRVEPGHQAPQDRLVSAQSKALRKGLVATVYSCRISSPDRSRQTFPGSHHPRARGRTQEMVGIVSGYVSKPVPRQCR